MTTDKNGREWAKLSQLNVGDKIECDSGFDCVDTGAVLTVQQDEDGKYIACDHGRHYLNGHLETDGDHLVGVYPHTIAPHEIVI